MPTSPGALRRLLIPLLLSAAALGGCSVDTSVSLSGATAARVQHLYVTVSEVWLNTSATAAPSDPGWVGSALATPITVDIAGLNGGMLQTLASGIKTPAGTYQQVRLVLQDSSAALTSAAQSAGLTSNAEVQYLDASNNTITVPVELPSPASQLIFPASIALNGAGVAQLTQGASAATTTSTPLADLVVDLQSNRNLLIFNYGAQTGALLNATGAVYDTAKVGGISGTVDVLSVPAATLTGPQGILVTAESVSADGTRYQALKSASLQSNGAFTLFPLPVATTGTTTYDLVIHGPGIRTVVISKVPVTAGDVSSATVVQTDAIGLASATHYTVNTAANSAVLPGGSRAGFYQTLPGDSVPHLIEYAPIDPFTGGFDVDWSLSADAIDYGVYTGASNISFSTSAPGEGIGTYRIAADAPLRLPSVLTTTISAPTTLPASAQPIFLLPISASGNAASISGTVNLGQGGRFNNGFLLISHGGELVDSRDLSASLATGNASVNFTVPGLPGGVNTARYDVSVRVWNSSNPAGTLKRAAATSPADLSTGNATGVAVTVP